MGGLAGGREEGLEGVGGGIILSAWGLDWVGGCSLGSLLEEIGAVVFC